MELQYYTHKKNWRRAQSDRRPKKKFVDKHHLFPRGWLQSQGIDDLKQINQIANFTVLEWPDNIEISDSPPHDYVPKMKQRFDDSWSAMCESHALPTGWEDMSYTEFLVQRRILMARLIRRGFDMMR